MKKVLLVKYGEIALRKGNRGLFERHLAETIQGVINDTNVKCSREQGRLLIEDNRGDIDDSVLNKIVKIFGITAICVATKLDDTSIDNLKQVALSVFTDSDRLPLPSSFKVETKRADKRYPMESREVSASVGEYVLESTGVNVDVKKPEQIIWIEIRTFAYVYTRIIKCESGLPYGSSGKGILLLSGGIDSPVAGYLIAKRGMEIVPTYFHSPPHTSERAKDKVIDLAETLCNYIGQTKLYVIPFTDTQMYIYENMPHAKLTIYLKRAMLRISSLIAEKENAQCLITGDSLGQVASQTSQAIAAVDSAASHALLRPLIAIDKQSIINIAHQIETYEISIRPFEDCCTIFVPKHPEHKPSAKAILSIEARHDAILNELCHKAANDAEIIFINS